MNRIYEIQLERALDEAKKLAAYLKASIAIIFQANNVMHYRIVKASEAGNADVVETVNYLRR